MLGGSNQVTSFSSFSFLASLRYTLGMAYKQRDAAIKWFYLKKRYSTFYFDKSTGCSGYSLTG